MFGERGADALAREVFVLFLPNFVRNLFRLLGCVGQPVMKYIILVEVWDRQIKDIFVEMPRAPLALRLIPLNTDA